MIIKPVAKMAFQDVQLDVYHLNNERWLTLPQIVGGLGMTRKSLDMIYKRHRSEFTPDMTGIIQIPTGTRGSQQTRVFSRRGVELICMLAKSDRAASFRVWVLDQLEERRQSSPPAPALPAELRAGLARLWRAQPQAGKLLRYWRRGFSNGEAAKLLDLGVSTVRRRRREAEALGLVAPPPGLAVHQARALRLVGGTHHG